MEIKKFIYTITLLCSMHAFGRPSEGLLSDVKEQLLQAIDRNQATREHRARNPRQFTVMQTMMLQDALVNNTQSAADFDAIVRSHFERFSLLLARRS